MCYVMNCEYVFFVESIYEINKMEKVFLFFNDFGDVEK